MAATDKHWTDYLEEGYMRGMKKSPFSSDVPVMPNPYLDVPGAPPAGARPGGGGGTTMSPQYAQAQANSPNTVYPKAPPMQPGYLESGMAGGAFQGADLLKRFMERNNLNQPVNAMASGGPVTIPAGLNVGNVAPELASQVPAQAVGNLNPIGVASMVPGLALDAAGVGKQPWAQGVKTAATVGAGLAAAPATGGLSLIPVGIEALRKFMGIFS